jgi:hypothetical protein
MTMDETDPDYGLAAYYAGGAIAALWIFGGVLALAWALSLPMSN